jgi:hypothetical protein
MVNNEMSTLQIFRILDQDNSNSLEPLEILNGLKNYLHVYLSREETNKLSAHLDEDGSGDIDFHEFDQKIDTDNLKDRVKPFVISKTKFIEKMLGVWSFYKDRERRALVKKTDGIDVERPDGVLDLETFKRLIKSLEPSLTDAQLLGLYKSALEQETNAEYSDKISTDTLLDLITENRIAGYGKELFSDYLDK